MSEPARWPWPVFVFVIAIVPYLPTTSFGPTYDDHHHVVGNPFLRYPENAALLVSPRYLAMELPDRARPVLLATHFVDRALFGDRFPLYHLTSVLLHALSALLAFALARTLALSRGASAIAAALFALHPACVEAIASVSNREEPLAALFVLATLLFARRALAGSAAWLAPLTLAFTLALLSKEVAVAAPLLLLVLGACSSEFRPRGRRWMGVAVALAIPLAAFAWFQIRLGAPSLVSPSGAPLAAFATSGPTAWAQIPALGAWSALRLIAGYPMSAVHDPSWLASPLAILLGAVGCAGLVALAVASLRRDRRLALPILWLAASIAPVAAAPLMLNPIADRFLYLPAIGAAIGGVALVVARVSPTRALAGLALLAALYAAESSARVPVWHDDVRLFTDAVEHAPRVARAWHDLGAAHLDRGELDRAERATSRAAALEPDRVATHLNLALIARRRGHDGLPHLERAVALQAPPGEAALHERAFVLLAEGYARTGDRAALERLVTAEERRDPASALARGWRRRLASMRAPAPGRTD